jgi:hypothetical protein
MLVIVLVRPLATLLVNEVQHTREVGLEHAGDLLHWVEL